MKKVNKEICTKVNGTGKSFKEVTEKFAKIANEYLSKPDIIPSKPIKLSDRHDCIHA